MAASKSSSKSKSSTTKSMALNSYAHPHIANHMSGTSGVASIGAHFFSGELPSTAPIERAFREILRDPQSLNEAANYLYQSLLDDATIGVFMEIQQLHRSGNLAAMDGLPDDESDASYRIVDMPNYDIFGVSTAKKPMDCTCPNCDRPMSAARFAQHLAKCMGMGRLSSRIASRRLATKEGTGASSSSSYLQSSVASDDDDDVDWATEKRRKKTTQSSRNNGAKNNGKGF